MVAGFAIAGTWESAMEELVDHLLPLSRNPPRHEDLRRVSAAISMFVHLSPRLGANSEPRLVNRRRRRTVYGSYPTPPDVAFLMARHIEQVLRSTPGPATILDPTIEGGPLILECARLLAHRPQSALLGIDRSVAAVAAVTRMFDRAPPAKYLRPHLIHGNSLKLLDELEPVDALINNPPWGERLKNGQDLLPGPEDPCVHFIEQGLRLLRGGGGFALVLPGQVASSRMGAPIRSLLSEQCTLDSVTTLPPASFRRATVRAILVLGRKLRPRPGSRVLFVNHPIALAPPTKPSCSHVLAAALAEPPGAPWTTFVATEPVLFRGVAAPPLSAHASIESGIAPYRRGRGCPPQTAEIVHDAPYTFQDPAEGTVPILRSRQVRRFACAPAEEFIRLGAHLAATGRHSSTRHRRRVFVREICSRKGELVAAPAPAGVVPRYGIISIAIDDEELDTLVLCAILNSTTLARYVRSSCDGLFKESFNRIRVPDLRRLPIPPSLRGAAPLAIAVAAAARRCAVEGGADIDASAMREVDALVAVAYDAL